MFLWKKNVHSATVRSYLVGGFNPFEKYWSKWESSPNRGENKKGSKPPPSYSFLFSRNFQLIFSFQHSSGLPVEHSGSCDESPHRPPTKKANLLQLEKPHSHHPSGFLSSKKTRWTSHADSWVDKTGGLNPWGVSRFLQFFYAVPCPAVFYAFPCEPRKKTKPPNYFSLYWFVNRDPYIRLL